MFDQFGLVLVVNHACNLRCRYCYTGEKYHRAMTQSLGQKAIDRAIASLSPDGTLELGFFGGEPLIDANLIQSLNAYARSATIGAGARLSLSLTTNGTITTPAAWSVLNDRQIDLSISHDGLPEVHDRHRVSQDGRGSSDAVLDTIRRLMDSGRQLRVIMVVRPDSVERLTDGIKFLWNIGVREFEPSLDVWTTWTQADIDALCRAVDQCARVWRDHLPDICIGWFDEKAAALTQTRLTPSARCGFGAGEIAVAPSGHLYPCERLVGADHDNNPMRLPGHCRTGDDFLSIIRQAGRNDAACSQCALQDTCNTTCRCSNYIRTKSVSRPDRLLCDWNQACIDTVANLFQAKDIIEAPPRRALAQLRS